MKKVLLFLVGYLFLSFNSFSQDYSFCYGTITVTLFDGGNAEMVRSNSTGIIVSRVKGTFDLYGKENPTEVLKIKFQGTEYRYDLIRDGFGKPSVLIDVQARRYLLCKTVSNGKGNENMSLSDHLKNSFSNKISNINLEDYTIIGNLVVMNNDLKYGITSWQNAKSECESLGNGWRLPTRNELLTLYNNKNKLKNLNDGFYWSSTNLTIKEDEYRDSKGAFALNFIQNEWGNKKFVLGKIGDKILENLFMVRAVRDKTPNDIETSTREPIDTKSEENKNLSNQINSEKQSNIVTQENLNDWYVKIKIDPPLSDFDPQLYIRSYLVFNNELYAAGNFESVDNKKINCIAKFNGTSWSSVGVINKGVIINSLVEFRGELYAGGNWGVKKWDGKKWEGVGYGDEKKGYGEEQFIINDSLNESLLVRSVCVYNNELYAGGSGGVQGTISASLIKWDGKKWHKVSNGLTDFPAITTLAVYKENLYVGAKTSWNEGSLQVQQKKELKRQLLQYCKLDTMATVIIAYHWGLK